MRENKFLLKGRGNLSVLLSAGALLVGFLLIFAGLNTYKYLTTRDEYSSKALLKIAKAELDHIDAFFERVSKQLEIVKDLGENGVLEKSNIIGLNKKFIPLLKNQRVFGGVILADETGWEYFLYRDGEFWTTRITRRVNQGSLMEFTRGKAPDKPVSKWKKSSIYDPRKRPWFTKDAGKVHWSALYTFFQSGEPGITASISWKTKEKPPVTMVFAMDIPSSRIKDLLDMRRHKMEGLPFLLDASSNKIIAGKAAGFEEDETLLKRLVRKWEDKGKPQNEPVSVENDSYQWFAVLSPVSSSGSNFFLGVVVPERVVMADFKKALFRFDLKDAAAAVAGGLLLVFLFWRFVGFDRGSGQETDPFNRLMDYIRSGEGDRVEFKSTVRTNLRSGKPGKEIELAWLKALVAFLNSEGGVVLIGVDDTGRIVGVGPDNFENSDRCLLHVKNLINQHIGAEFTSFMTITLVEVDEKEVVMIECAPSKKPVFLKMGKNEEFYVRTGPSSVKLSPSQTISYLQHSGRLKPG